MTWRIWPVPRFFRRAGLLGDAPVVDLGQLESLLEGVQGGLRILLAGEALPAEAVECLQLGLTLFQMLPLQNRFCASPSRMAVDETTSQRCRMPAWTTPTAR